MADHDPPCAIYAAFLRSASSRDLHVDAVGVLYVQAGIVALERRGAAFRQVAPGGVRAETRDADREVVDAPGGAAPVERDQRLGVAEANDLARLLLAHHGEAEYFPVELDGALQVRDLDADVVDVG